MPTRDRASRLQARVADGLSTSLLADMQRSRTGNARWSVSSLSTVLAATPVHLITGSLVVLAVLCELPGTAVIDKVAGGFCLGLAYTLRPRFTPNPRSNALETSPGIRRLIADVALAVGAPMPSHLVIDSEFNARARRTGLRGRTLTIGAPLWAALAPPQRVALLGHELGHFANGDVTQTRYVHASLVALHNWDRIFAVKTVTRGRASGYGFLARVMLWPVRALLTGYAHLIELLGAATSRRQEHYADLASVAAGGTEAAIGLLEVLLRHGAVETTAARAYVQRLDVFDEIAAQFRAHDADSHALARQAPGASSNRIDASHPPTLHRISLVESYPGVSGAVSRDSEAWGEIDRELSSVMHARAKSYAESIVHRR